MSHDLVFGAAALAGLACPVHMRWSHRQGRHATSGAARALDFDSEIEDLRARQQRLGALVAQHDRRAEERVEAAHTL